MRTGRHPRPNSTALFTSAAATADPPELVSTAISAPVSFTLGEAGALAQPVAGSPPAARHAATLTRPPRPTRRTSVLNQRTMDPRRVPALRRGLTSRASRRRRQLDLTPGGGGEIAS